MSRNILDFHEIVVYTLKSVVEVAGYKVLHCFGEHGGGAMWTIWLLRLLSFHRTFQNCFFWQMLRKWLEVFNGSYGYLFIQFYNVFWSSVLGCINVSIVILFNKVALYQYKHAFFTPGRSPCSESYSVDISVATNGFLLIDVAVIFLHNFKPSWGSL